MNEEFTEWFYGTTPPIRAGVYETRVRGLGHVIEGYSYFDGRKWCSTQRTALNADRCRYTSAQQSKEWRGLAKEPK